MSIPEDERGFYEAAAAEQAEADLEDGAPAPTFSEDQLRELALVSMQAGIVLGRCPDLLRHLERAARRGLPAGVNVSASEAALWRTGFEDCVQTIRTAADWTPPEDSEDGRRDQG